MSKKETAAVVAQLDIERKAMEENVAELEQGRVELRKREAQLQEAVAAANLHAVEVERQSKEELERQRLNGRRLSTEMLAERDKLSEKLDDARRQAAP